MAARQCAAEIIDSRRHSFIMLFYDLELSVAQPICSCYCREKKKMGAWVSLDHDKSTRRIQDSIWRESASLILRELFDEIFDEAFVSIMIE